MLIVYKSQAQTITVTASELATELNPIFVFDFIHHQSEEQVTAQLDNISLSPQRFDEFVIDEGVNVTFPYIGDYTYRIIEQQTNTLLEVGRLLVKEAKPLDNFYTDEVTDNIYNGEEAN